MFRWTSLSVLLSISLLGKVNGLLFPDQATSLGLVASVSVPITELLPERRFIIDWCFQMAYDLPGSVSKFYNIPIWPIKSKTKRHIEYTHKNAEQWSMHQKYVNSSLSSGGNRHPSDFTAGELYRSIEEHLSSFGYHRSCLLRSVCELAQHPFDDKHQNMLTDILTFLLTPSWHQGFEGSNEEEIKQLYEDAEVRGFDGENCTQLYADCEHNLLSFVTGIDF